MTTRYCVVAIGAALTLVCSTSMAQTSPHQASQTSPPPAEAMEYDASYQYEGEYGSAGRDASYGSRACGRHCGNECGCVVGTATHVGYPRCFNFRSPCTGGCSCGCCGTIFGELLCDIREWGVRLRSYRAASCAPSNCVGCGGGPALGCSCSGMGSCEPSCDGGFEPGCGFAVEGSGCCRPSLWGGGLNGLSSLFAGSRGNSCGCNGCQMGSSCCCGSPRDAAAFGNSWYPSTGGNSYPMPSNYPHGSSIQEAPIEPIPAANGAVSSSQMHGAGRKSIHYYTQNHQGMGRPMPAATTPNGRPVTLPGTQVARAPSHPSASTAPVPTRTMEPEVRVREEIPAAPNSIRRMSFEFGAGTNAVAPQRAGEATVRFADDCE